MKLKLKVEFKDFVTSDEFGKRDQCKWFRFVGPLNPSAERSSRKRHSSTIFEANTCLLLIPCYLQGESYLDRRQCDRSIKRFLRARNYSVYYRKTTSYLLKKSIVEEQMQRWLYPASTSLQLINIVSLEKVKLVDVFRIYK